MKKLLKSQMRNVSDEQLKQVMMLVNKNPELFQKIMEEIKVKAGEGSVDQMKTAMEVMKKYEKELKDLEE